MVPFTPEYRFFQKIDGELSWQSAETVAFSALYRATNSGGSRCLWISDGFADEIASCCLTAGMPLNQVAELNRNERGRGMPAGVEQALRNSVRA